MKSKTSYRKISPQEFLRLTGKEITIVEFGFHWCGRCSLMSSLIQQVIIKCSMEIEFVRIDMELSSGLKELFNVFNQPTYLVFNKGKIIDRIDRLLSQREFQEKINSYINGCK